MPVIWQENHFDPFGLNLKGIEETDLHTQYSTPEFRFQYNGKEKTETHRLMWNNHGARNLDLQLGRWWSLDPLSEKDARFSPFCFAFNNPIKHNDPDGKWPIETVWDIANVIYDIGSALYNHVEGNHEAAMSNWQDAGSDALAMAIPFVPAGTSKLAKGAGKVIEVAKKTENVQVVSRKGAMRQAKRDAGIPKSQTPKKGKNGKQFEKVNMTDKNGKSVLDENGNLIETREYTFTKDDGSEIVIQDHSAGHKDFGSEAAEPHLNVRPKDKPRNGKVEGTMSHYPFKK